MIRKPWTCEATLRETIEKNRTLFIAGSLGRVHVSTHPGVLVERLLENHVMFFAF